MAKQSINRGTAANDGTGDNLRAGAQKVNNNFDELYNALGNGTTLTSGNYLTDASTNVITNKTIKPLIRPNTTPRNLSNPDAPDHLINLLINLIIIPPINIKIKNTTI